MSDAIKFPKTPRLSNVLKEDIFPTWKHALATVEEKIDGANAGIWFENGSELRLQSRGHVLRGGAAERQFAPFHGWAAERHVELQDTLGDQFVIYGEWCFAKNKAYYDALPDWFIGYDVLDRQSGLFLPTAARDDMLTRARITIAARLWSGTFGKAPAFASFLGPSKYKTTKWRDALVQAVASQRIPITTIMAETDDSDWMEGVYVRIEDKTGVIGRMKAHREGYMKVQDHEQERQVIRNRLAV